jgi:hypothetical protein
MPDVRNGRVDGGVTDHYQQLPLPENIIMHNAQQQASLETPYDTFNLESSDHPRQDVETQVSGQGDTIEVSNVSPVTSHQQPESVSDFGRSVLLMEHCTEKSVVRRPISQNPNMPDIENTQLQSPTATLPEREESVRKSLPESKYQTFTNV